MLEARGAHFTRVLDLYAGTGALGIEALSRGAESADFIEKDRATSAIILSNLRRTGLEAQSTVHVGTLPAALVRVEGPFGLIFCDPPYGDADALDVLARLTPGREVDETTTIVYEHSRRTMPPEACAQLPRQVSRRHGETVVSLYYQSEPDDEGGGT
jgi:16S rRNA (guanine966-N2)-methyltransferase